MEVNAGKVCVARVRVKVRTTATAVELFHANAALFCILVPEFTSHTIDALLPYYNHITILFSRSTEWKSSMGRKYFQKSESPKKNIGCTPLGTLIKTLSSEHFHINRIEYLSVDEIKFLKVFIMKFLKCSN